MPDSLINDFRQAFNACQHRTARNLDAGLKQRFQQLADSLDDDETSDLYGSGALIEALETEVAELLGKEAAVFLPSGTMAQPIALKIWSEAARTPYVAMHSTSHVLLHEHNGYQALYGLHGVTIGQNHQVPTLEDLQQAALNPLAAVLLELPMREIGGQLPPWDDLVAQTQWLKAQGIRVHMDGARLWQCPAAYDKSLADIAALFDSVYVSFYKDLGGLAGACLVGDQTFIDKARIWIRRAGGNLYSLAPYVVAAREGLKTHLPQMPKRREQAIWLAGQLNALPGISTWPRVPQTNMFRLRLRGDANSVLPAMIKWMQATGIGILTPPYEVGEDYMMTELTIGDGFNTLPEEDWLRHIASFGDLLRSVISD
ncbi:threonine aldolase family protein [Reinekea blandensis]|uniref:Threonine aldolase putative n=1 Tax=Reinekea blandensis MED297 TaxID=314283 RepID=A4BDH0_9GAMM|nr:beta-eliminating lyase-related protein [Reinekea blandensis]EAR09914.1 Threonine aldolase putative [Reinekea sp. MED297] [Reinekea blandensis MED297]